MSLDPKTSKKDKLRVCSLALHPLFTRPLIDVAEMSIEKGYQPLNWLNPHNKVTAMYLIEAAQRHLDQVKLGIDVNTEEKKLDGSPTRAVKHGAQVAYNMLMLLMQQEHFVDIDDRLFEEGRLKTIELKEEHKYDSFACKTQQCRCGKLILTETMPKGTEL